MVEINRGYGHVMLSYLLALKALFILVATTAVAMQLSDTSGYAASDWLIPAMTTARPSTCLVA